MRNECYLFKCAWYSGNLNTIIRKWSTTQKASKHGIIRMDFDGFSLFATGFLFVEVYEMPVQFDIFVNQDIMCKYCL